MILAIAIVMYAVGVLISARLIAGHLAWKWKSALVERPERLDWLAAGCYGLGAGFLWPALLLIRAARRLELPAIGAEREAHERQRAQARDELTRQHEKRIAELEANIDEDAPIEGE